jgi:hypothetical protein
MDVIDDAEFDFVCLRQTQEAWLSKARAIIGSSLPVRMHMYTCVHVLRLGACMYACVHVLRLGNNVNIETFLLSRFLVSPSVRRSPTIQPSL